MAAKDKIASDLDANQHFVFPGNGTFDMTTAQLNENGDLLAQISYVIPSAVEARRRQAKKYAERHQAKL